MNEVPIRCPSCGHDQFVCVGLVVYNQPYNGSEHSPELGRWDAMEFIDNQDYAMQVRYANAAAYGADVTQLFLQKNIIAVAYRRSVRPGRRTP